METITSLLAFVVGFLLRLAIPIAITAIAIYLLKNVDKRWQVEAQSATTTLKVEKPKCWEVNGCSPEDRKTCPGFNSNQPCWQAFRAENGYLKEPCLGCDVFLKAPVPVQITN